MGGETGEREGGREREREKREGRERAYPEVGQVELLIKRPVWCDRFVAEALAKLFGVPDLRESLSQRGNAVEKYENWR